MPIEVPTIQPRVIPVTAEAIADAPDQPLAEDVNGIAELSAHAAIISGKGKQDERVHPKSGPTSSTGKS